MAEIGKINTLTVKRKLNYGAQLDGGESGDILLPKKYVPKKCQPGYEVEVFVYVDNNILKLYRSNLKDAAISG
jgi:predicted RNA-binding protein (virulence factor B family)